MAVAKYVELRIHGVIGTPPEDMLQSATVAQVAGDQSGRFLRPSDGQGAEVRSDPQRILEGYHWGRLTSGRAIQAFWLVLIPFGLVNAAYFMLPKPAPSTGSGNPHGYWCRLIARGALRVVAIIVTIMSILAVCEVLVDLIGWQRSAAAPGRNPRWLLLLTLAVAAGAVLVFRFLGRSREPLPDEAAWTPPADVAEHTDLVTDSFLRGDTDVVSLRRLHTAAGWSVVGCVAADMATVNVDHQSLPANSVIGLVLLGLVVVLAAAVGDPKRDRSATSEFVATTAPRLVQWASGAYVVVCCYFAVHREVYPAERAFTIPALVVLPTVLVGVAVLSLGVLLIANLVLAFRTPQPTSPKPFRRFVLGQASSAIAAIGVFTGIGMFSAFVYGVFRVLNSASYQLALPSIYPRIAYAWGITACLVALLAVLAFAWSQLVKKQLQQEIAFESNEAPYASPPQPTPVPAPPGAQLDEGELAGQARLWARTRLHFHLDIPALKFALAGVLMSVVAGYECLRQVGWQFWRADSVTALGECSATEAGRLGWLSSCVDRAGPDMVTIGTVSLYGLGLALLYLGRTSLLNTSTRRTASIVWDVISFWPQAVHPLVPTNYAPKVIEDLRRRVAYHLGLCSELAPGPLCTCPKSPEPVDRVVLAGHSQGSLIAVAAVGRLQAAARSKVSLLTFGSQLQFAYSRAFPAYVNFGYLRWVFCTGVQTRWRSLYRETDPIGGPVQTWDRRTDVSAKTLSSQRLDAWTPGGGSPAWDTVDAGTGVRRLGHEWRLLDPALADGQTEPHGPVRGHGDYYADDAWRLAIAELVG